MTDFDQIIEEFTRLVWKQALRMLGNQSDASDCLQTVFLEAFEVSRRLQVRNWSGFLKHLTTVRALDLLRTRYRQLTLPLPETGLVETKSVEPSQSLERSELSDWLRRALAQLPDIQSEAFTLRWIAELNNDEIALQLEVTANHVGVLLHRAKIGLQEILIREGIAR